MVVALPASADEQRRFKVRLKGFEEVPSVSTVATGEFEARIANNEGSVEWELSYSGLQGTVTQAHIHLAQKTASGGISVWLCQTATNPAPAAVAAQTPMCGAPGTDGPEATAVISAEDVIGPTGQAGPAAAFADLMVQRSERRREKALTRPGLDGYAPHRANSDERVRLALL